MKNTVLIQARKNKKWTQEQLATKMDCKKSSISNWERGYCFPKLEDAFRLSMLLDKPISSLFSAILVQDSHTFGGETHE